MVNIDVYEKLKEVARNGKEDNNKGIIFYEEVMAIAGLDITDAAEREIELAKLLDDINREERKEDRPMITAVVVHKNPPKIPGQGFFKLANEWNRMKEGQSDKEFWIAEINSVWDCWSRNNR